MIFVAFVQASFTGCFAMGGVDHMIYVAVPNDFPYFTEPRLWICEQDMTRNVVILAQTAARWVFDVYISWLPTGMEISQYTATESNGLYRTAYVGAYSVLQCMFALWPIIGCQSSAWQEIVIYPDSPGGSVATIHVRHSLFPRYWWSRGLWVYTLEKIQTFCVIKAPELVTYGGEPNTRDYIRHFAEEIGPYPPMVALLAPFGAADETSIEILYRRHIATSMYLESFGTSIEVTREFLNMLFRVYGEVLFQDKPRSRL